MSFDRSTRTGAGEHHTQGQAAHGSGPGKTTLTSQLPVAPVQRRADQAAATGDVHAAAAHGISGAATAMPYAEQIQRSFGRHGIDQIQAHVGGTAEAGAGAMGADAFAVGDHVAFAAQPDLHTAAHEAAHVVQQRGGVQLHGGVGQVGDPYEQHADAVADLVVQGKSSEALLDRHAGGHHAGEHHAGSGGSGGAVQRHAFVAGKQVKKADPIAAGAAASFVADDVVRSYETADELKKHAAHQTDYLGNLADGTWLRFSPAGLNVLGEMHTLVGLRMVVTAVGSKNFIDERLSMDDLAPGSHMKSAYETENASAFKEFGIEHENDKKQFGAESLFPKIGFAMSAALPYFIGPKKLDGLTSAGDQYDGQPIQRYLKIGWAYGRDVKAKVAQMHAAKQQVPPKLAALARIVTQVEAELDPFLSKLPADGFLGDALAHPDKYRLLPSLAILASALLDATVEQAIADPSSRMDDAQKKKFAGTTTTEDKGALMSNWRNAKFEESVKRAAQGGVRYAGMGALHLYHLQEVGLPSNAHAFDMSGTALDGFQQETERLKGLAGTP
jgi:uncharacterized protein DUF4157